MNAAVYYARWVLWCLFFVWFLPGMVLFAFLYAAASWVSCGDFPMLGFSELRELWNTHPRR